MGKYINADESVNEDITMFPAETVDAREKQLIALATDLAAQQLANGTASSQVITHFLKLGTTNAKLEREKLIHENELLRAKTESLESQKKGEEFYQSVIAALKKYGGDSDDDEEYEDEY